MSDEVSDDDRMEVLVAFMKAALENGDDLHWVHDLTKRKVTRIVLREKSE